MSGYYAERLSGMRLRRVYEIAPPRVGRYLEEEVRHAVSRLGPDDMVLELGCGYGRVAFRLADVARHVVGIDTAAESIELARALARSEARCEFHVMDATAIAYPCGSFDAVVCVQNGICAFGVDQVSLLREALRVLRGGGVAIFSSYSDRFWRHRLAWFEAQAAEGLLGPVDRAASRDGTIACEDGFRSGRVTPEGWRSLCERLGVKGTVQEIDGSSVFCEIRKPVEEDP